MIIIVGNGHSDLSSNPGQAVCISHSANTLGEGHASNFSFSSHG